MNSSQQEYCITNDGDVLLAGDSWKANACTSCTCNNGTIQCFSQSCPAASCRVPVLRKGQCCPHCLGERLCWGPAGLREGGGTRPPGGACSPAFVPEAQPPLAAAFRENILLASAHSHVFPVPGRIGPRRSLYGGAGSESSASAFPIEEHLNAGSHCSR